MADLGSAILQGIQSVQDAAARRQQMKLARDELALSQQRTQSALAVDQAQLKKLTDDENRLLRNDAQVNLRSLGDNSYNLLFQQGFVNVGDYSRPINTEALKASLLSSDPIQQKGAVQATLSVLNHERRKRRFDTGDYSPDDFEFTYLDPEALKQGRIVAGGSYKDGRPGVATVDGSSDPNAPIMSLTLDEAMGHMQLYALSGLLPESNLGASSAPMRAAVSTGAFADGAPSNRLGSVGAPVAKAAAPASGPAAITQAPTNQLLSRVDSAVTAMYGADAVRAFRASLLEVKDNPEEYKRRLIEVAKGIDRARDKPGYVSIIPSGVELDIPRPKRAASPAGADRRANLVEPDKYAPSPRVVHPAVKARFGFVPDSSSGDTPLSAIEKKITSKKNAAANLTGDARISAEAEIAKLENQRFDLVNEVNVRQFQGINSRLAEIRSIRDNSDPSRHAPLDAEIQKLESRRAAYVQAGFITPVMKTEAYKALETRVFDVLQNSTPEEMARLISVGRLRFSKPEVRAMTTRAREVGVKSVTDVAKLGSRGERLALLGMLYAWAPDSNAQNTVMTAIRNVAETGTASMSAKDVDASMLDWARNRNEQTRISLERRRLLLEEAKFDFERAARAIEDGTDVGGFIAANRKKFVDGLFSSPKQGEEPLSLRDRITPTVLTSTAQLYKLMQRAQARGDERSQSAIQLELNSQISILLGAIGNENSWNVPLFSNRPSSLPMNDETLSRVRLVEGPGGVVKGFQFKSPSGEDTGAMITADQLDSYDPVFKELVVTAVRAREAAAAWDKNAAVNFPGQGPRNPQLDPGAVDWKNALERPYLRSFQAD